MPEPNAQVKRVLIVDGSASIRAWLKDVLHRDPNLSVIGEAGDAFEARKKTVDLKPDVITLDVDLPKVSGLAFLQRLMEKRPIPVVMVSAATADGSAATLKALALGALDCIQKPTSVLTERDQQQIAHRVLVAANSHVLPRSMAQPIQPSHDIQPMPDRHMPIILVGASTGGIVALETFLPGLDPNGPPVVIVQHMPGQFLGGFVESLNRQLSRPVLMGAAGKRLCRGEIIFAPAQGKHTEVSLVAGIWRLHQRDNSEGALHCPAVDALFHSAVPHGDRVVSVLLTGLGRDGAEGMLALHRHGAKTLCQNEQTCVIYGMPKTAQRLGGVDHELPLNQIAGTVNKLVETVNWSGP